MREERGNLRRSGYREESSVPTRLGAESGQQGVGPLLAGGEDGRTPGGGARPSRGIVREARQPRTRKSFLGLRFIANELGGEAL